ncbi:MAG TPA: biosynthetic peptidoglycan transglycosylase, partial [Candidatus Dormibacteraeota bacterium]|nr:biosynthetic peptidoglycan transglycosylase [Candidatus Dormibacteraeota bacterium]
MPSQPLSHHPGPISRSGGIPPRKPGPRRRASQARGGNGLRSLWRGRWYLIFALLAGIGLSGTYVGWTLRDMPDPGKDLVLTANQVILDRNGQQIEDRNAQGEFHVSLRLADMGTYGPAATLAAEDRDFYKHGAISPSSLGRAVVTDIHSGGYAEGGSTITQQLVKIQLLSPQKSVFRKIQEAVLAEGLELRYSKDQILEMYLNRVYYGNGAYGLGAAAKTYFNQNAADLTAAQAALLAGL